MARKTIQELLIEHVVNSVFKKVGCNRQFNIMDLSKITAAGTAAGRAGQDVEAAVRAACDKYEIK